MVFSSKYKALNLLRQHCQNDPRSLGSVKTIKTLYLCQANSWRCQFVNMHVHDVTVFTSYLHGDNKDDKMSDDNNIVFRKLHFETRFQKFAFQSPKTQFLCKQTAKMHKKLKMVTLRVVINGIFI